MFSQHGFWRFSTGLLSANPLNAGAGQGIGRAYAHALGEAGAAVAVVDIQEAKAKEVVQELSRKGVRAIAIKANITDSKACEECVLPFPYCQPCPA